MRREWSAWACERKPAQAIVTLTAMDPDTAGFHYHDTHSGLVQCLADVQPR